MGRSRGTKPRDTKEYVAAAARRYGLTPRLKELACLLFEGASIKEAARQMRRKLGTVKAWHRDLYMVTDSHSRSESVSRVYEAWIDERVHGSTDSF